MPFISDLQNQNLYKWNTVSVFLSGHQVMGDTCACFRHLFMMFLWSGMPSLLHFLSLIFCFATSYPFSRFSSNVTSFVKPSRIYTGKMNFPLVSAAVALYVLLLESCIILSAPCFLWCSPVRKQTPCVSLYSQPLAQFLALCSRNIWGKKEERKKERKKGNVVWSRLIQVKI